MNLRSSDQSVIEKRTCSKAPRKSSPRARRNRPAIVGMSSRLLVNALALGAYDFEKAGGFGMPLISGLLKPHRGLRVVLFEGIGEVHPAGFLGSPLIAEASQIELRLGITLLGGHAKEEVVRWVVHASNAGNLLRGLDDHFSRGCFAF